MSDVEEPNGVWGAVVPASLLPVEEKIRRGSWDLLWRGTSLHSDVHINRDICTLIVHCSWVSLAQVTFLNSKGIRDK